MTDTSGRTQARTIDFSPETRLPVSTLSLIPVPSGGLNQLSRHPCLAFDAVEQITQALSELLRCGERCQCLFHRIASPALG